MNLYWLQIKRVGKGRAEKFWERCRVCQEVVFALLDGLLATGWKVHV